jgi:hypothetical protein
VKRNSRGGSKFFLRFVEKASDEFLGGSPFPLGDTPLKPGPKVFPPFARSGQRILADVSHLIAEPAYPNLVFVAMLVLVGYLTY